MRPGLEVYDPRTREFEFRPGPLFANVVLVDEINRAMPKTQSALLEAMAETQVTVGGATRPLPRPFLLLATENPIEHEGTFPLPEAQLDRFFLKTALGYPGSGLRAPDRAGAAPRPSARATAAGGERRRAASSCTTAVEEVYIDRLLVDWLLELVRATTVARGRRAGRVRAGLARPRAGRAGVGAPFGPLVRRSGGHRGALPARRRPPRSLLARRCSWSFAARGRGPPSSTCAPAASRQRPARSPRPSARCERLAAEGLSTPAAAKRTPRAASAARFRGFRVSGSRERTRDCGQASGASRVADPRVSGSATALAGTGFPLVPRRPLHGLELGPFRGDPARRRL